MTELRTERLLLRRARPDDLAAIHAIMSNPAAMQYWSTLPHDSVEMTAKWFEEMLVPARDRELFIFEHNGEVIGRGGVWKMPEIGYILHPDHWGRGFATEGLAAIIEHVFRSHDVQAITADVDPRNGASRRVMQKLGFAETGYAQRTFEIGGAWYDSVYLALPRPAQLQQRR